MFGFENLGGLLGVLVAIGSFAFAAFGLRQKATIAHVEEESRRVEALREDVRDHGRRLKDCEDARDDLTAENRRRQSENTHLLRENIELYREVAKLRGMIESLVGESP